MDQTNLTQYIEQQHDLLEKFENGISLRQLDCEKSNEFYLSNQRKTIQHQTPILTPRTDAPTNSFVIFSRQADQIAYQHIGLIEYIRTNHDTYMQHTSNQVSTETVDSHIYNGKNQQNRTQGNIQQSLCQPPHVNLQQQTMPITNHEITEDLPTQTGQDSAKQTMEAHDQQTKEEIRAQSLHQVTYMPSQPTIPIPFQQMTEVSNQEKIPNLSHRITPIQNMQHPPQQSVEVSNQLNMQDPLQQTVEVPKERIIHQPSQRITHVSLQLTLQLSKPQSTLVTPHETLNVHSQPINKYDSEQNDYISHEQIQNILIKQKRSVSFQETNQVQCNQTDQMNFMAAQPTCYDRPSSQFCHNYRWKPNIKTITSVDILDEVKRLRASLKGIRPDENVLIQVICTKNSSDRKEILDYYCEFFMRNLIKDIKSQVTGTFRDLLLGLFMEINEFLAFCLHNSMNRLRTNNRELCDIICTLRNDELKLVKNEYFKIYRKTLETSITATTSGSYR